MEIIKTLMSLNVFFYSGIVLSVGVLIAIILGLNYRYKTIIIFSVIADVGLVFWIIGLIWLIHEVIYE